jgi:UDPglucose 6-dehydrogenase
MKMSYANTLAEVCERIPGADAQAVAQAVGADSRIGLKYLTPATAFGGPCLVRDLRAFSNLEPIFANAIDTVNLHQRERLVAKVRAHDPQRVAVLGLAYKPNTSVTDESVGMYVAAAFERVTVYDPMAMCTVRHAATASSAEECVRDADVVVVATAWPEFADVALDGQHVIDCWGLLEHRNLANYERLGRHDDGHVLASR